MPDSSSIFDPASPQAQAILNLFYILLGISLIIFLIVVGAIFYSIIRSRRAGLSGEPAQVYGNTKLELTWTLIPLLIIFAIFGLSVRTMYAIDAPHDDASPDLIITGHQWWWEVEYPASGVVTANEIHVPAGQRLRVQLESDDVIHDFWVPALGRKMDAIPGHPNHFWLEAAEPDTYLGACAEYCGLQHAWMRLRVIAQTEADFAAWQQQQLATPPIPTDGVAAQGYQQFHDLTCINCHAIAGTDANADVGPDLTHLGSRETIGAGVLANTTENLTTWLKDPQAVKPGNHMPQFSLTDNQLQALVTYLEGLK